MTFSHYFIPEEYGGEMSIEINEKGVTISCYEGIESASVTLPVEEMRYLGALLTQFSREADNAVRHGKLT